MIRTAAIILGLAGVGYTLILLILQSFHLGMLPSALFGAGLLGALFVPPGWGQILLVAFCLFWALFFLVSLAISRIGAAQVKPGPGTTPKLLIVLGYQLQKAQAAPALLSRLNRAAELAERFPEASLVLSGGQPVAGPSEASVMAAILEGLGVSKERMILEEASGSSFQNMERCRAIWEANGRPEAWVVTSSFHALRAYGSAKAAGLAARVVSAPSPAFTYPAEVFREGILYVKTALFGYASMAWANGKL